MEEGKNILKIDGPISNKTFFKNLFVIVGYTTFGIVLLTILHLMFEITRYNIAFFVVLWALLILVIFYATWINFFKRIWDIIGDKSNAIFYTIALFIANISVGFIPFVKYIGIVLSIAVLIFLARAKGKLVEIQPKENNDVA